MASSKLMSRNSDLKRKLSTRASTSSDFLIVDSSSSARDNPLCNTPIADSFFRNTYVERNSSPDQSNPSVLDTVSRIGDVEVEPPKRTVDDVWREIMEGKKDNEQKRQHQHPKEEMITLEDFLVKVGAVEEKEAETIVDVKEEGMSFTYENKSDNYSGRVMETCSVGIRMDVGGFGNGRGKRSVSLLEPLDKVAQQRQRRMIKNRESAARSRERKQAYQVELESMAMRLEEENERLLNEMAEHREKRLKQLMENVIPVTEKRRPPRVLKRIRSMQW